MALAIPIPSETVMPSFSLAGKKVFVTGGSRWWNASGIDLAVGSEGLRMESEGLITVLLGGIAFETPADAQAMAQAPANATFLEADATDLPFADGSFDLVGTMRTLHHVRRPELVVAELARVVLPGGRALVVDQLAPADPLEAFAVDRFERARDPDHARLLSDQQLRHLFEANRLALVRERRSLERRPLGAYLDLAACEGEARQRVEALAPHGTDTFDAEVGWYLLRRG